MGNYGAIFLCFAGVLATGCPSAPPQAYENLAQGSEQLASASSCLNFPGTGGASTVPVGNICTKALQFDVEWRGTSPPRIITYRIGSGPNTTRTISRRDTTGTIVREGPAAFGLGPRAEVRIETSDRGEGQTLLQILNPNLFHAYAEWEVRIMPSSGSPRTCRGRVVMSPADRTRICVVFTGHGEKYEVVNLAAEQDPD
jgi:hypothetical protein